MGPISLGMAGSMTRGKMVILLVMMMLMIVVMVM